MIRRALAVSLIAATAAAGACKKKKAAEADDASAVEPTAKAPPTTPVDPDPNFEELPDTATADAAPVETTPISEAGTVVFNAADSTSATVAWTVDATELQFSAGVIGSRDDSADVQIAMASGGRQQRIATCRGLSRADGGAVTAYSRGDDVAFVSCFTRTESNDKGKSWGVRIKWNQEKRIAEIAGNFESEGQAAFDTMDFDERPE
jgi:hypothetical protein